MNKLMIIVLSLLFICLQTRLWVGENSIIEWWSQRDYLAQLTSENERLFQRNNELASEVLELQKGMEMIEEQARYELGLVRRGETFFLMSNTEN